MTNEINETTPELEDLTPKPRKKSGPRPVKKLSAGPTITKEVKKKGSFKPGDLLQVLNKDPNYAYRWLNATKLEKQGWTDHRNWEIVRTGNSSGEQAGIFGLSQKANALGSMVRNGDLVLARMPKEDAEARNEYYRKKNDARMEVLTMKNKFRSAGVGGNFEQRRGNRTIKENWEEES